MPPIYPTMADTSEKNDDSEDIPVEIDDVTSIFGAIGFDKFKISAFLFILFLLVSSDVFIDRILSDKDDTYVSGRSVTSKGTMAQSMIVALVYIVIAVLVECNYI
jgi:hypothetical protein